MQICTHIKHAQEAAPGCPDRHVTIRGHGSAVHAAQALLHARVVEWQTSPTIVRT